MTEFYLPFRDPKNPKREVILFIPGASMMDKSQLRDIIQKQREVIPKEMKAKGQMKRRLSRKDVSGELRDFRRWLERKQATR